MPQALVTLPDGRKAKVTFDSPEQLDSAVSDLTAPSAPPAYRGIADRANDAVGEPLLQVASGMAASAAGGIAGVARGAGAGAAALVHGEGAGAARDAFVDEATDTIHQVGEAGTYQPRTPEGKAVAGAVQWPFQLLAKGADKAGDVVAGATGSPALGAATNVAIQSLPGLIVPGLRGLRRPGPAAAQELSAAATVPRGPATDPGAPQPPAAAVAPPAPPADLTASPTGPRAPASDVGGGPAAGTVPRETPPPSGPADPPNVARAKTYAGSLGLDWARLGAGTRKALESIAQDSAALERLNPAAVKRQAHLEGLRVPVAATRGQLERDPVQLRREAIASHTSEGQPIRDVDLAANRDLQANLEVLRGRVGGQRGGHHEPVDADGNPIPGSIRGDTKTPSQVGEAAQAAAREKAKWSKKGYDALYKAARATEPDAAVPLAPVTDLLTRNPEIQHLGWVQGWLNKAAKVKAPQGGEPVAMTDAKLAELHDLRSDATAIARTGGKEGHYAGEVVKAIDQAMEAAPAGAAAWKRANAAFKAHQAEFKDQGIVRQLTSQKKGGADRALALEQTWAKVATGPLEQVRQAKKTLLTGGTPATRMAGRKAWRDIRAETVNQILEDARNVTSADESERAILTEAALRRSIKRIPRENLEEILGVANVRELNAILRARRITTRSPVGGRTTQSGTIVNALALFEKVLKHIPGGSLAVGAKHVMGDLMDRGGAAAAAENAAVSPLEQAVRDVEATSRRRSRKAAYDTLESLGPTLSPNPPPQPQPIGQALKRP